MRLGETAPRFGRGHLRCLVTGWTGWDGARLAHNPGVAGSNPAPATKARGHFSNREGASCMWFVHGMLAVTLVGPEDPAPGPQAG